MDAQDLLAARDIRVRHHDLAVEAAGTQQRRVEHVGPVGRGDDDDALVRLEAVHLDQELVQRLLALVIAAAEAGAAMTADGVDFVDEDDAGRVLLGLLEHVAHAARADADEHLDEVGARDGEERHIGLAGDGARGQASCRCPGGPTSSTPRGMRPPSRWNFCGSRRNSTISCRSSLASSMPATSSKVTRPCASVRSLALRLAEAHGAAGAVLHLAGHEDPQADEDDEGQRIDQQRHEPGRALGRRASRDLHALLGQGLQQRRIAIGRIGHEAAAVREGAGNLLARDHDIGDAPGLRTR